MTKSAHLCPSERVPADHILLQLGKEFCVGDRIGDKQTEEMLYFI